MMKNGGPAFPCPQGHWKCGHPQGMSVWDWFAGEALANSYTESVDNPRRIVAWASEIADLMLAERERRAQSQAKDTDAQPEPGLAPPGSVPAGQEVSG